MAILLFVHLTCHSSTASEQLSCISPVPAPLPLSFRKSYPDVLMMQGLVSPVLSPARISVSSSLLEKATMSQKSSLPQPAQSVSWVLTADTSNKDAACISRQSQLEPSTR
jgi:hypothetical protein